MGAVPILEIKVDYGLKDRKSDAMQEISGPRVPGLKLKTTVVVFGAVALFLSAYLPSWFFLRQLGLAGPMANLSYFYYGKFQTDSDGALYIFYFPIYWFQIKTTGYSRYGIHWSDRKPVVTPSLDHLIKNGVTDDELRNIGFTDKEVQDAHMRARTP